MYKNSYIDNVYGTGLTHKEVMDKKNMTRERSKFNFVKTYYLILRPLN